MESLIGQIIDNYRIDEIVGRGGMGVVFKATDMNLEKTVALKMIDPFLARDENFLKRFKTEAKALARLENPNIVSVYALRETSVGVFMVMEYVKARTVSEWIRERGKLSVKETLTVSKQLLNAIGHAHSVGVIHRDIKPNNILLCDNGNVKVMDFGLAKVVQDISQNTMTQTAAGTLYYMSPEQIKGLKNVDNRSDIYSVGMSIYEMAAGRTPFDKSKSEYEIQKQIIDGDIPSPIQFNPGIPKSLVKLIKKSIEKDPAKRFQNIDELKAALNEVDVTVEDTQDKTIIADNQTRVINPEPHTPSPRKILIYWIPALLIIVLAVVIYFSTGSEPAEEITAMDDKTDSKNILNVADDALKVILTINSTPPAADVYINGNKSGTTPFYNNELEALTYSVMLKKPGYEQYSKDLSLKAGANGFDITLKPVAEAAVSTLILNSVPPADIYIDNKSLGTSVKEIRNTVKAGSYNIKFIHPQYGTKNTSITLKEGQSRSLTCYFEHQVNIQSLNKSGEAFWGTVYINGTNTNLTTPVDLHLGPGKYEITVKKAGYKTVENDVVLSITPGFERKSHPIVFHFQ
jgi:eukaryotic-like serine/threonine-protein kinase